MNRQDLAIGVFDSGMGGLTVLKALKETLPEESFIYLGDTARLPYGTKSADTVKQYAMQMATILIEREIKALVIACNTATTAALSHLQSVLTDIPVIGVVEPGALAAVTATENKKIAILATETTIASKAYQNLIQQMQPGAEVRCHPSSLLVALAEEGMTDNHVAESILQHYLQDFKYEDTLLLGCTHFPVFKAALERILPVGVKVVDSAHATADSLKTCLEKNNLLRKSDIAPQINYLVTDSASRFCRVGEIFLGKPLPVDLIELVDAGQPGGTFQEGKKTPHRADMSQTR